MTMRKPFQTQWVHGTEPIKPEPLSERMQKVIRLPMPGPGIVLSIPVHLWIEYKDLYHLEPNGLQEPKSQPKDGPGEAILLVKRVQQEGKK